MSFKCLGVETERKRRLWESRFLIPPRGEEEPEYMNQFRKEFALLMGVGKE